MQIGRFNVRRIVITVIVLVVAGLTATSALANSPHFKKGRERSCLMARSAISKPITCKAVLAGLGLQASVPNNNNSTLPYDEFGLNPNQPSRPQVGSAGPQTGRAVAEVAAQTSVPDDNNNKGTLPYDEFGLGPNQPNQPQVGSTGPQTGRAVAEVAAQTSVPDDNNSTLPYDEFGLGANQPNQPRVGSAGP